MAEILGISGSLRRGSFNTALLHAAAELTPSSSRLDVATIEGIPLYNQDIEAEEGIPGPVASLKDRIAESDGVILATPEYNHSIPGPFKNAVDWLSRPQTDQTRVFGGRPVALLGASPSPVGTRYAQDTFLSVLHTLGMRPWFRDHLFLSGAGEAFDDDLRLADPDHRDRLARFLEGFVGFVEG